MFIKLAIETNILLYILRTAEIEDSAQRTICLRTRTNRLYHNIIQVIEIKKKERIKKKAQSLEEKK
jgi:hypothetical protein